MEQGGEGVVKSLFGSADPSEAVNTGDVFGEIGDLVADEISMLEIAGDGMASGELVSEDQLFEIEQAALSALVRVAFHTKRAAACPDPWNSPLQPLTDCQGKEADEDGSQQALNCMDGLSVPNGNKVRRSEEGHDPKTIMSGLQPVPNVCEA